MYIIVSGSFQDQNFFDKKYFLNQSLKNSQIKPSCKQFSIIQSNIILTECKSSFLSNPRSL